MCIQTILMKYEIKCLCEDNISSFDINHLNISWHCEIQFGARRLYKVKEQTYVWKKLWAICRTDADGECRWRKDKDAKDEQWVATKER